MLSIWNTGGSMEKSRSVNTALLIILLPFHHFSVIFISAPPVWNTLSHVAPFFKPQWECPPITLLRAKGYFEPFFNIYLDAPGLGSSTKDLYLGHVGSSLLTRDWTQVLPREPGLSHWTTGEVPSPFHTLLSCIRVSCLIRLAVLPSPVEQLAVSPLYAPRPWQQ